MTVLSPQCDFLYCYDDIFILNQGPGLCIAGLKGSDLHGQICYRENVKYPMKNSISFRIKLRQREDIEYRLSSWPALITRFMGPKWGPSGPDRTQVGPMMAPWTLLSGWLHIKYRQYLTRIMVHNLFIFSWIGINLCHPYLSGLLHWHWGNLLFGPVPVNKHWRMWVNHSYESTDNWTRPSTYYITIMAFQISYRQIPFFFPYHLALLPFMFLCTAKWVSGSDLG